MIIRKVGLKITAECSDITCYGCQSELLCFPSDFRTEKVQSIIYEVTKCPVCKNNIWIKKED